MTLCIKRSYSWSTFPSALSSPHFKREVPKKAHCKYPLFIVDIMNFITSFLLMMWGPKHLIRGPHFELSTISSTLGFWGFCEKAGDERQCLHLNGNYA